MFEDINLYKDWHLKSCNSIALLQYISEIVTLCSLVEVY
jgi:hypothetical protein